MNNNEKQENKQPQQPDMFEQQSSIVESHIVIKDPESGEVILNQRD